MKRAVVAAVVAALVLLLVWWGKTWLSRPNRVVDEHARTQVERLSGTVGGPDEPVSSEDVLLPIAEPTLAGIHAVFAPNYAGEAGALLPQRLRPALEEAVFHDLSFAMRADAESLRFKREAFSLFWAGRPLSADYKVSDKELRLESEQIVGGPIRRVGFTDLPFTVEKRQIAELLLPGKALPPELAPRLQRDYIVVTVHTVRKLTPSAREPGLYRPTDTVYACDPDAATPVFCRLKATNHRPLLAPAVDLPQAIKAAGDENTKQQ